MFGFRTELGKALLILRDNFNFRNKQDKARENFGFDRPCWSSKSKFVAVNAVLRRL